MSKWLASWEWPWPKETPEAKPPIVCPHCKRPSQEPYNAMFAYAVGKQNKYTCGYPDCMREFLV